jgi:ABC-2 type transport system permease protein
MLLFCLLQGGITYVLVNNTDDPTPPKELVNFTLQNAITVGLLIGLILGADSISGERERGTLEALLLTPTSRRQLVVGKFLAGISVWLATMVITVPLMAMVSQGDEVFGPALFWGIIMGLLIAPAFTALGMILSFWSNSNKTSLFVSLTMYFVFFLPTLLLGGAQKGRVAYLLKRVNPMESFNHFLENVLVNNRTPHQMSLWFTSPVVFAVLVFGLLFLYASPGLRLEGGKMSKFWSSLGRRLGLAGSACLIVVPLSTSLVMAFQGITH